MVAEYEPPARLTPREMEVWDLARAGLTNRQIAEHLGISRDAVRYHLKELHSKLETGGHRRALIGRWARALIPAPLLNGGFWAPASTAFAVVTISVAGYAGVLYASRADSDANDSDRMESGATDGGDHCLAELVPRQPGTAAYPDAVAVDCFETAEQAEAFKATLGE